MQIWILRHEKCDELFRFIASLSDGNGHAGLGSVETYRICLALKRVSTRSPSNRLPPVLLVLMNGWLIS